MVQKVYTPLSCRIAEEKQLLAEEKWIIDALTKIRNQRNCLQIERLELESLKTQLIIGNRSALSPPPPLPSQSEPTSDTAVKLMASKPVEAQMSELEAALVNGLVDDTFCNEQQLDLTVTNPIFSLNSDLMNVEEEESDASDDSIDENPEGIFMDINMFMNSDNSS